jgi:hypothetical protein
MYSYIPIIDLDLIDFSKLSIKDKKILYDSVELSIKISSTKIGLSFNKDSIQLYSNLLFKLRDFIDELYKNILKKTLTDEENSKLRSRPQNVNSIDGEINKVNKVTINFYDNFSSSRIIPSNTSKFETIKIRQKNEFFEIIQKFYPYINSTNSQYNVVGDFILKVFFSKNNNFCSFVIFDSDISYCYNKKRTQIYNNTIITNKIINSIEI